MKSTPKTALLRKTSFWLSFSFYFLIAFEFFYMISPFAAYLYSIYGPGLEFFARSQATNWLTTTFLPHIVIDTRSVLLNNLTTIGFVIFSIGLLFFIWGAGQIYLNKIRHQQFVSSGLYTLVGHPQYSALMICGFGMMLLWPRYIVLITYMTMLFIYVLLARLEEHECLSKFGSDYRKYHNSTPMFFPLFPAPDNRESQSFKIARKVGVTALIYVLSLSTAILCANLVRGWAVDQLYAEFTNDSVNISVQTIDQEKIGTMLSLAIDDKHVRKLLGERDTKDKFINYIVPLNWSASEIPMHQVEGQDHFNYSQNNSREQYKIIITRAELANPDAAGREILWSTTKRIALAEVSIDFHKKEIIEVRDPVQERGLNTIPLPLY